MKTLGIIKEHEKKDGRTRFLAVANSGRSDRDGEVIKVDGWTWQDKLPSLLYGHQTHDPNMVMGAVEELGKEAEGLTVTASINDEAGPTQQVVGSLVRAGDLSGVSVGFDPFKWIDPGGKEGSRERGDGWPPPMKGREYISQELLELSLVPVQSDMGGLIAGMKALAVVQAALKAKGNGVPNLNADPGHRPVAGTIAALTNDEMADLAAFVEGFHKYGWRSRLGLMTAEKMTQEVGADAVPDLHTIAAAARRLMSR